MQEVDDCISKCVSAQLFNDFKQELFLRLMEYPQGVIAAYKDGKHKYYTVRVILSLANRQRDIFHKKYLANITEELTENTGEITDHYCEPTVLEVRRLKESEEERMMRNIENIEKTTCTPYYRMMIDTLKESGSYREISRRTGIPIMSVSNAFKKIREVIK